MAKGDDAVRKKQNKVKRKKLHNKNDRSSSAISARVASIIAAKKRRHSGKRRKCQVLPPIGLLGFLFFDYMFYRIVEKEKLIIC